MAVRARTRRVRMYWAPSLARRVMRHRAVWIGAAALVVIGGSASFRAQWQGVAHERSAWGTTTSVVVVDELLVPGDPVANAVSLQVLPEAMVPAGAMATVPSAGLARVTLFPGEVLLAERVTTQGATGLPAGTAALTLQVSADLAIVGVGDLVDIWMVDSANLSSTRVAEHVVVLMHADGELTVAVPEGEIAEAAIATLRPVTVVLVG